MSDDTSAPTRRSRYSLRSLFVTTALVAGAVVIWQLYSELAPLRAELRRLRTVAGELSIDDPKRIVAVALDGGLDDHTWKWRVYLPKDHTYALNVATSQIPKAGEVSVNCGSSLSGGSYLVTAGLRKQSEGTWAVVTRCQSTDGGAQQVTFGSTCGINPTSDWLEKGRGVETSADVGRVQVEFVPRQPVELIRVRALAFTPAHPDSNDPIYEHTGTSTSVVGPADGFAVWIESTPSSPAAGQSAPAP